MGISRLYVILVILGIVCAEQGIAVQSITSPNGVIYTFYNEAQDTKTFHEAAQVCESNGGSLAIVNTAEINEVVGGFCTVSLCPSRFFIGATDRVEEGQYRWLTSHVLPYNRWCSGEPNGRTSENCIELRVAQICWNDVPCSAQRNFICQNKPAYHSDYLCDAEDFSCLNADIEIREQGCYTGTIDARKTVNHITDESTCVTICKISVMFHCRSLIYENDACYLFDQAILFSHKNCLSGQTGSYVQLAIQENGAEYIPRAGHLPTSAVAALSDAASYSAAQSECNNAGSLLLMLNNEAKETFLLSMLQVGEEVWIGLSDETIESAWQWEDGTYAIYTHFKEGQPNGQTGSNCVKASKENQNDIYWYDVNCDNHYKYICEPKPATTTQRPLSTWLIETTSSQTAEITTTAIPVHTTTPSQFNDSQSSHAVSVFTIPATSGTLPTTDSTSKTSTQAYSTYANLPQTYSMNASLTDPSYNVINEATTVEHQTPVAIIDSSDAAAILRWEAWTAWSKCTRNRGRDGTQFRLRLHVNVNSSKTILYSINNHHGAAMGIGYEDRECYVKFEGVCMAWSAWPRCSQSCEKGTATRTRECFANSFQNDSYIGREKGHTFCSLTPYCGRKIQLVDDTQIVKESDLATLNKVIGFGCIIPLVVICVCIILSDLPVIYRQISNNTKRSREIENCETSLSPESTKDGSINYDRKITAGDCKKKNNLFQF